MTVGYSAVVIGVSSGGLEALSIVLPSLPEDFGLGIAVVQHRQAGPGDDYMIEHLNTRSRILVKEATEKARFESGVAYIAPPGYHLLIERDHSFALSLDPPVHYARPSIDVLFDSAAFVYEQALIGVILTGANSDGATGLAMVKARGGTALVQEPRSAYAPEMPQAAIDATLVDYVRPLEEIANVLTTLGSAKALQKIDIC